MDRPHAARVTNHRLLRRSPANGLKGRPAPPDGRSVGCGSFRGASPALCWAEAGSVVGLLVLGLAGGAARAARLAVDPAIRPAGILPGLLASGAPHPRGSRRAARRILARSVARARLRGGLRGRFREGNSARVGRRRRLRGRDPSRQRRVSHDCRSARNPRRGRTRSPGLVGPDAVPDRRDLLRFERFLVELREARTFAVSDLKALLHIKTYAPQ